MKAALIRGGTSKGLFLRGETEYSHLPPKGPMRDALILRAMGSPDPSGMQLDGVGGGISSTSKVALITRSTRQGFDVDYCFGQVALREAKVDWSGNCGNLAAAVGLFAQLEGLAPENSQVIKVWQENLKYEMRIHMDGGPCKTAAVALAGVPGEAPPIYVEFVNPMMPSITSVLPTGMAVERLRGLDVTLIACANPTVFIRASDLGLKADGVWDYGAVAQELRALVAEGAARMGITNSAAFRIALLSSPCDYKTSSGVLVSRHDTDLLSRITTEGRFHHAHTTTGAINLAVASRIPNSIPHQMLSTAHHGPVRIGHPGGVVAVEADVCRDSRGLWRASSAGLVRTARVLFRGTVEVPLPASL